MGDEASDYIPLVDPTVFGYKAKEKRDSDKKESQRTIDEAQAKVEDIKKKSEQAEVLAKREAQADIERRRKRRTPTMLFEGDAQNSTTLKKTLG